LDVARSKTGKHGSAKAHITVIDPATGKKVSHILPASQLDAVRTAQSHALVLSYFRLDHTLNLVHFTTGYGVSSS
jgi:translation elongation factor P/translation initiation factor 5A